MDFCAGNPTSTFGGGGGTKLFCSQALNAPHTSTTRMTREAATAFFECDGIIPVPQCILFQETILFGRLIRPSSIPTIRLRWNPKPKMMPRSNCSVIHFKISLRLKRRSSDNNKEFLNDQHVETSGAAGH